MASPDVFRSPTSRTFRRETRNVNGSSSPGLPSLQDLLTEAPSRPPFQSPNRTTSATQNHAFSTAKLDHDPEHVSIIDLDTPPAELAGRPQTGREPAQKRSGPQSKYFTESQPWRKYKSPPRPQFEHSHDHEQQGPTSPTPAAVETVAANDSKGGTGRISEGEAGVANARKAKQPDDDGPLLLEAAPGRRLDWTPPAQTKTSFIDLGSDSSAFKEANSSAFGEENAGIFKDLLQTYGCDLPQAEPVTISDEDSSFVRKRKLVELIATTTTAAASPAVSPEKPQSKPKAAKKKARTITEVATAAYRPIEPAEVETATQAQLDFGRAEPDAGTENATATTVKGKGKAKAKAAKKTKKPTKASKKVEHKLLSPSTALKQSAAQDFLFGTSSQLVREHSPTLLRDIQAAMKNSNTEMAEMDPFMDSDGVDASSKRLSLWDAGARDDGGGLLDIEVVDLADQSSPAVPPGAEDDPFGYHKAEGEPKLPQHKQVLHENVKDYNESFETLSDILPPRKTTATHDDDGESVFSLSDISASTDIRRPDTVHPKAQTQPGAESSRLDHSTAALQVAKEPKKPAFELYTDIQLSKEIKKYGFKAVKRRTTMISLLEQCWRSKHGVVPTNARTVTTLSTAPQAAKAVQPAETPSPKRPRGRPKKIGSSPIEIQEPPPSAQPVESPKKPRGRPRKTSKVDESVGASESVTATAASPKKPRSRATKKMTDDTSALPVKAIRKPRASKTTKTTKAKSTPAVPAPTTPVKKSAKFQKMIEIPDSASENGSDDGSVLSSSPDQTFSSPTGVDMSVSMEEDTELRLDTSPNAQQASVFERITVAVTTAPRSADPNSPSWHEKILMYDPIILEDFAAWLNSGQLSRVGHDDEVNAAEVKTWCESKSICCLWRLNLHGVSRKRY